HTVKGGHLEDAVETPRDLLLRLRIAGREELVFEIGLRGRIEFSNVFRKWARVDVFCSILEQLSERVDRSACNREQQPGYECECRVPLAGQFSSKSTKDVVEILNGCRLDLLLDGLRICSKPWRPKVEHVEGGWMVHVLRVNDDQAV